MMKTRYSFSLNARKSWFDVGLPFSINEYESRVQKVRTVAEIHNFSCLVIHGDRNDNGFVRWLSNLEPLVGSSFLVIPTKQDPILISDSVLHGEPMHSLWWMTWIPKVVPSKLGVSELLSTLAQTLKRNHLAEQGAKIGYVKDYAFSEELRSLFPEITFRDVTEEISEIKAHKSVKEIDLLKKTTRIAAKALTTGCEKVRNGASEGHIAGAINGTMMELGAHDVAFCTMVLSGKRTHLKHSPPLGRKMKRGEMVFIDCGASLFGYVSDICRTLTVGTPTPEQRGILNGAIEIHRKSSRFIRNGLEVGKIVSNAKSVASEFGLEKNLYVDGHGIGTSMFDPPSIRAGGASRLGTSETIAYEPMIFSKRFGTVSFEDDYLVKSHGSERLTQYCPQRFW